MTPHPPPPPPTHDTFGPAGNYYYYYYSHSAVGVQLVHIFQHLHLGHGRLAVAIKVLDDLHGHTNAIPETRKTIL